MSPTASSGYSYDVFISHNRADKDWARHLARSLQRRSIRGTKLRVFFDEWSILVGESIPAALRRGLRQSRHVLLVMSPEWVTSEWCQLETDTIIAADPSGRHRRLIPILLRECDIPADLRRLKYLDFTIQDRFGSNFKQLIFELSSDAAIPALEHLHERYREELLNAPILPQAAGTSPSLSLLWPDCIVDPLVQPRRRRAPQVRFSQWCQQRPIARTLAVVGQPGAGKTTLLQALALQLSSDLSPGGMQQLPVYTTAAEVLASPASNIQALCSHVLRQFDRTFTQATFGDVPTILMIDGVDEIGASDAKRLMSTITTSTSQSIHVWMGCRDEFFRRQIAPEFARNFDEILEIVPWCEADISLFADNYARTTSDTSGRDLICDWRAKSVAGLDLLGNPFRLTLLLCLAGNSKWDLERPIETSYELYSKFYEHWTRREHHRGTARISEQVIARTHRHLAFQLADANGRGVLVNQSQLASGAHTYRDLFADSSFAGLLISTPILGEDAIRVSRYVHETIGEYLIAESVISALWEGGQVLFEALCRMYNYNVNAFVREAISTLTRSQATSIFRNLESLYARQRAEKSSSLISDVTMDGNDDRESLRRRARVTEQVIYYIGRLPTPQACQLLRFAYQHETDWMLRRMAAIGGMLHGDEWLEQNYLSSLTSGSESDIISRSAQLVYFGDVQEDIHSHRDTGKASWAQTRERLLDRLRRTGRRELCLRWWDLRTIRLFHESRDWRDSVSHSDCRTVEEAVTESSEFSRERNAAVTWERDSLLADFRRRIVGS